MNILALSDIHQYDDKWKKLLDVVENQKPDMVIIGGDLYPKSNGIRSHVNFIPSLRKYAKKIRNHSELVFILGNDDNNLTIKDIDDGEKDGLWYCVHDRVAKINGFSFCGCSWVPDYPFAYKYWVAKETSDNLRVAVTQYGRRPCLISEENTYEYIDDLKSYLANKKSIIDHLLKMSKKIEDPKKSIWLIHSPPANSGLDVCSHGERVGSHSVLKFIHSFQPLLSLHGHIHESPEYNGGKWHENIGDTVCVQPGQLGKSLYYVNIDIKDGKINSMEHSVYGKSRQY